ncbi:SbcC/MukB-like Walker B domain-containing protein [Bradyrhizobium sp. STM 3557]|uniref:SbcC/MukB-like Walker B domain-containing protein n=1 Tax=Bradyrhizobium sp. STM 3557 TaxID=578920 RepID=UPI003890CD25
MMELRHVAMVNWHLFDIEDIEISGHVGVFGENRSGKSTILDMAQVVLTGGNRNVQRLNAVAGDKGRSRSASKRSVVDYCLGTLGEDQRKRDQARTYICLGFADSEGQRDPVTIGMAIEARRSESNETVLGRFVVTGKILTSDDFVEMRDGRKFPAEWDVVRNRIIASVGQGNFVNHRDKAIDYVREYMRKLVPHVSVMGEQNANALQKAVVNAMTLDHDQTATEFVRNYVLERNNMRVGELRESIRTYRSINDTIKTMREKLEALLALRAIIAELAGAYERRACEQWITRRGNWLAARAAYAIQVAKLSEETAKRDAAKAEMEFLDQDIEAIDTEIRRLDRAIAEHDARTGRNALAQARDSATQATQRAVAAFETRLGRVRALEPLCAMTGFGFDDLIPKLSQLTKAGRDAAIDRATAALVEAEKRLLSSDQALLDRVDDSRRRLIRQADDERARGEQLRERLRLHASGRGAAHLSDVTLHLCRRLRQANMVPRVLCELVEVSDESWTAAAEGLLGRDREAVFVDRSDIAQATALFKEGRREFRGASLVSLNKLDPLKTPPLPGTFPSLFKSDDADALAFIARRHGSVRLADTLAEFNEPGRAIMRDGLYDDGLVRSHRAADPASFKIGKSAQARLANEMRDEVERLGEACKRSEAAARLADKAYGELRRFFEDRSVTFELVVADFAKARQENDEIGERIAALDGEGDGGLRDKRGEQRKLRALRLEQRKSQQEAYNKHLVEAGKAEGTIEGGENIPGSRLSVRLAWTLYGKTLLLYDRITGRAAYRNRLDASPKRPETERHRAIADAAAKSAEAAETERNRIERDVRRALSTYFEKFGVVTQVGVESEPLSEVKPWMDLLIEEMETSELRKYERQAREAAEKAATLLRGQFINALTSRIAKMERELAAMNRGLADHPFHNERYSFHHTRLVEFQPILKIIEIGKTSPEALDMLFRGDEVPEDFPHRDTLREIELLLEDPEKDFSEFEDYRNFFTFEILMKDIVSGRETRWENRRATGSGAEQQVPIYVSIGASLASVYGSGGRHGGRAPGMALAIFDEAFSKMDGKNQRQMMSFYKKLGLQIIIAAPNEKRVAVLEHIDTVIEVDRIGESARATVAQLKERARAELRAMDPDLLSDDELKKLAAE